MDTTEAQELLNLCERSELRDHAFGDREVFWKFMDREVASGYFGGTSRGIVIYQFDGRREDLAPVDVIASFENDEAYVLSTCGRVALIERNDMQGDDIPNYGGA